MAEPDGVPSHRDPPTRVPLAVAAAQQVREWLAASSAWVPVPTPRHGAIWLELVRDLRITGPLVSDAHLAQWHDRGIARTRLSTTVDAQLLKPARRARSGVTNATFIDEALAALLARHRSCEVDASFRFAGQQLPRDGPARTR